MVVAGRSDEFAVTQAAATDADADADGAGDTDASTEDPSITVDPEEVAPGDDLTVEGSDFQPEEEITVDIVDDAGNVIESFEVITDEDGNFVVTWTVPDDLEPGVYSVIVTDSDGNTYTADFNVIGTGTSGSGEADTGLASTGANSTLWATGVALLLIMVGAALYMVRRNRMTELN